MTRCTSGGYDQLETSPDAIEQELRPAVCERRQTDLKMTRQKKTHSKYYNIMIEIEIIVKLSI